jgi:hypothetical protein
MAPFVRYKVGDLVSCAYDFFDFFKYYWYGEEGDAPYRILGLIVAVADVEPDSWFDEPVYQVCCTDGIHRYFLEDEIQLIQVAP